jgi:hypothetical protein
MQPSAFAIAAGVATVIAFSAATHAQTRDLTVDEVKNYFAQVQRDATQLVKRRDIDGIRQWSQRHVADGARFKVLIETIHENKPKMWSVIDLDKADMQQVKAVLGDTILRSIQDYSLRIEVGKVVPHGADAATVMVTWSDSASVTLPAVRAAGQGQSTVGQAPQPGTQPRTLDVKRTFQCDHPLVREQGQLKIDLSSCRGQVQF